MDIIEQVAQHEVAVLDGFHVGDSVGVAFEISEGGRPELLGQAEIERRGLREHAADLIEKQPEPLVLGVHIDIPEILLVPAENGKVIVAVRLAPH